MRFRERTNFLVHRLILAGVSLAAGILALATGCDPRMTSVLRRLEQGKTRPVARQENVTPLRDWNLLRLGTFNLGVFGVEKSQQPDTLGRIADIIRQFDIVALQEIRSIDQSVMDKLVREVNALEIPGDPVVAYDYVLGPRLGRTSSKEQYAFIYNTNRISVDTSNVYTLIDEQDLLHREPFVARFISHADDYGPPFTFTLVNIHTDPDEAQREVAMLPDVLQVVQNDGSGEDDIILLGDFNLSPEQFGALSRLPHAAWVVENTPTNMRANKTLDNIVYLQTNTVEFRNGGVLDIRQLYQLDEKSALQVSDHQPVWADFLMQEGAGGPVALNRTGRTLR